MNKQLVLAVLLAVSMSAVRAEEQTAFTKAKNVAEKVVKHPATKITVGVALTAGAVINLIKFRVGHKGIFTNKLELVLKSETGDFVTSYKNLDSSEKAKVIGDRVLDAIGMEVPVAAALVAGLGLIGSGIYDVVKRVHGEEKKA